MSGTEADFRKLYGFEGESDIKDLNSHLEEKNRDPSKPISNYHGFGGKRRTRRRSSRKVRRRRRKSSKKRSSRRRK